MLLLPQKLSDQWKARVERGGEFMKRVEAVGEAIIHRQPFGHTADTLLFFI